MGGIREEKEVSNSDDIEVYLPKQVIERLIKYISEGCSLTVVKEEFNGEPIQRWVANGNRVLWSAPITKEDV
jgi:hypothetical protein